MKLFSTKVHGFLDYTVSLIFIVSPWLFGFANGGASQWFPIILGIASILMSIFTDYEAGLVRNIPMIFHLGIDVVAGLFLALSPWVFGFAHNVTLPHLVLGLFECFAGLTTAAVPRTKVALI